MKPSTIEVWVWLLVYGGLLTLCLGLAVGRIDPGLGWLLELGGAVVAALGVVLIVVRSRLPP